MEGMQGVAMCRYM